MQTMDEIRDALVAVAEEHEVREHQGDPCLTERANLVAFVWHALHLTADSWPRVQTCLEWHQDRCPDCSRRKGQTPETG